MATKANVRNLVISFFDGWTTLVPSLDLHFRIALQRNQWILGWMSCSVPRSLRLVTGGIFKWGIVESIDLVEIEASGFLVYLDMVFYHYSFESWLCFCHEWEYIFHQCDTRCLFVSEKCHNPRQIQWIMLN